jgi:hypothetical protein
MLSREENELLTRVHADRPMGRLFRRYWIPALLSEEIPEPDCPPVRVRLLGEDLIAFRDSQARIGLWANTAPIVALRCFTAATKSAVLGAFITAGNMTSKAMCSKLLPSLPGVS